jgi:xylulose-5-phosphate/fructose-6-phosphate phosphoketolase
MEQGSIDTPLVLAIRNRIDRFGLAMAVIQRVPSLVAQGTAVVESLSAEQRRFHDYALEHGVDSEEITGWCFGR